VAVLPRERQHGRDARLAGPDAGHLRQHDLAQGLAGALEALDAARRLATERRFEIDAALLEGRLAADEAGLLRSNLAEEVMEAVIPRVTAEFAIRHGKVAGGVLAVLAMGKLGGQEMLPGSDLDIVLLYDHAADAEASQGGAKSLAPSDYFIRLSHQIVAALSSPWA
jgi:glutamate-ammonia-ligase adenylyltransferase